MLTLPFILHDLFLCFLLLSSLIILRIYNTPPLFCTPPSFFSPFLLYSGPFHLHLFLLIFILFLLLLLLFHLKFSLPSTSFSSCPSAVPPPTSSPHFIFLLLSVIFPSSFSSLPSSFFSFSFLPYHLSIALLLLSPPSHLLIFTFHLFVPFKLYLHLPLFLIKITMHHLTECGPLPLNVGNHDTGNDAVMVWNGM